MGLTAPGDLVTFARDDLLSALVRAQNSVRLASPFMSEEVASVIAAQARAGRAQDRRLLSAVTERSVAAGMLSAKGLRALLHLGWEIRSIPNLHAKLAITDRT